MIESGKEMEDSGNKPEIRAPTDSSIYMFTYTSGTTGDPKASIIPHLEFISIIHDFEYMLPHFKSD